MSFITLLLIGAALLPASALAESFTAARSVLFTPVAGEAQPVIVELDPDIRDQPANSLRLIDGQGMATAYTRTDASINLMSEAVFDAVPIASGNAGGDNTVENIRDGSISTVFQPVMAESFRYRFHFMEPVTPDMLEYVMDTTHVSSMQVRAGSSFSFLHDVFAGVPSDNRIALSGESVRVFEITFTMKQGVPRLGEMKIIQPRTTLLFRAEPGQRYTLLYGGPERLQNPVDTSLDPAGAQPATLSQRRALTRAEAGDHDGIGLGDNCADIWNPAQSDEDGDVVGDACDNCVGYPNSTQTDANGDGFGDVCEDSDRDGIANAGDNCPDTRNSAQQDGDGDGMGNACDDADDRFTSVTSWLLWAGSTLFILVLAAVGYGMVKRSEG